MLFTIWPYFYFLPLTTNNPCSGHIESFNISHVHHVLSNSKDCTSFMAKFSFEWARGPLAQVPKLPGAPAVTLLGPPFLARQLVCGTGAVCLTRGRTSPRSSLWCPGLQRSLFEGPKPAFRACAGPSLLTHVLQRAAHTTASSTPRPEDGQRQGFAVGLR